MSAEITGRKHLRVNAYKRIKRLENQLAQAADLVGLLQRRWKRAAQTPAQQAAVDRDPLMRLMGRVVQTDDLPDDEYPKLAAAVEAQLQLERQRQLERQQRAQQRETRRRPGEGH